MPTRVSVAAGLDRELLTSGDFLEWLTRERFADLIDGEIFMHAAVSLRHADLLNFLDAILRAYIDRHRLGFLYRESVAVRLSSRNVFLPDLAFYRAHRRQQIRDTHVEGAPDLVVEVLSPRTADRDVRAARRPGVLGAGSRDASPSLLPAGRGDPRGIRAAGASRVGSEVVPGFFVLREWLDPDRIPSISEALASLPVSLERPS